jgi:hypothetical protein
MTTGRIRSLKPELLDWELLARCSDAAFRIYIALMASADDHGNARFAERGVASIAWQDTSRKPDRPMRELVQHGLVRPYAVFGQKYCHMVGWLDPRAPCSQRIDNAGKPRVPRHQEDDGTLPEWFHDVRVYSSASRGESRQDYETRGESPSFPETRGESPRDGETFRESPLRAGAQVRAGARNPAAGSETIGSDHDHDPPLPPTGGSGVLRAAADRDSDALRGGVFGFEAEAFADGIRVATGKPCTPPRGADVGRLGDVLREHGPNGESTGEERLVWLKRTASDFVRSSDARFGFSVRRFVDWLNADRPSSKMPVEATTNPATPVARHTMSPPLARAELELKAKQYFVRFAGAGDSYRAGHHETPPGARPSFCTECAKIPDDLRPEGWREGRAHHGSLCIIHDAMRIEDGARVTEPAPASTGTP